MSHQRGARRLRVTEQKGRVIGSPRGGLWQTEYGTKRYQLSLPYADDIKHGWAHLRASKGTLGTVASTGVNMCVHM